MTDLKYSAPNSLASRKDQCLKRNQCKINKIINKSWFSNETKVYAEARGPPFPQNSTPTSNVRVMTVKLVTANIINNYQRASSLEGRTNPPEYFASQPVQDLNLETQQMSTEKWIKYLVIQNLTITQKWQRMECFAIIRSWWGCARLAKCFQ